MLENPRSIKTLNKVKKLHSELRKYVDDADQWLNKVNAQSRKAKFRVTEIFQFFAESCQEVVKPRDEDASDDEKATKEE